MNPRPRPRRSSLVERPTAHNRRADQAPEATPDSAPALEDPLLGLGHQAGAWIVTGWFALLVVGVAWFAVDENGFWFMAGAAACLIVSLPFVVGRTYDLVSPWTLVVIAAYIGFGLRGLFISLGIDGLRTIQELYLLGRSPAYFYRATAIFLLGLSLLVFGWIVGATRRRNAKAPLGTQPRLVGNRVTVAVLVCAVVGFVAFVLYARSTGGFSLSRISAKRTLINGVDLEASYQSHGEYRALNTFASIAFWLQLAWFSSRNVAHGFFRVRGWWLGILFVNAALLPIYASTRADVIYLIIGAVLIEFCLRGRAVSKLVVMSVVVIAVLGAASLSSLRSSDNKVQISGPVITDTFVLTRTFADIPTSGQIISAVPDRLPYDNGDSIKAWLVAPVPRSLWPSKPLISSGPILGAAIYGNKRSGVPPGMIAESYWNFGLLGIFVIPLLFGFVIRRLSEHWAPYARSSPQAALLMAVVAVRPGIDAMANSVGFAPFQVIQSLIFLAPVLWFVGAGNERGRVGENGVTPSQREAIVV